MKIFVTVIKLTIAPSYFSLGNLPEKRFYVNREFQLFCLGLIRAITTVLSDSWQTELIGRRMITIYLLIGSLANSEDLNRSNLIACSENTSKAVSRTLSSNPSGANTYALYLYSA